GADGPAAGRGGRRRVGRLPAAARRRRGRALLGRRGRRGGRRRTAPLGGPRSRRGGGRHRAARPRAPGQRRSPRRADQADGPHHGAPAGHRPPPHGRGGGRGPPARAPPAVARPAPPRPLRSPVPRGRGAAPARRPCTARAGGCSRAPSPATRGARTGRSTPTRSTTGCWTFRLPARGPERRVRAYLLSRLGQTLIVIFLALSAVFFLVRLG